jgi:glutathione peroxidase
MANVYDYSAQSLRGDAVSLSQYRGQVLLVVNTASECGFTPQYAGLEAVHKKLAPRGFSVLGFPCNQFGAQEPGNESEIAAFCATNYGVTFPMFAKVEVNGEGAHPLFKYLKQSKGGILGDAIKWNFTKFLVDRKGEVVGRYPPQAKPESLEQPIVAIL